MSAQIIPFPERKAARFDNEVDRFVACLDAAYARQAAGHPPPAPTDQSTEATAWRLGQKMQATLDRAREHQSQR